MHYTTSGCVDISNRVAKDYDCMTKVYKTERKLYTEFMTA